MTKKERDDISLLNKSRIKRIATGSGTSAGEVNKLVTQFEAISKLTKQMAGLGMGGKIKAMRELQKMDPNMMPGMKGMPGLGGGRGSTATQSVKARFKQKKRR